MKIAILGFGTVGTGLFELIQRYQSFIVNKFGQEINIKYILVRDTKRYKNFFHEDLLITDFEQVRMDKEVDVVIEVIGGIEPAYSFILDSLKSKKHVVTANKELLALKGDKLLQIANENNVSLLFEASVCGAIPIVGNFLNNLLVNPVKELFGILNGSTNFILTKMKEDEMNFIDALRLAQEKGYAEKNPEYDITGRDAACKLSLLSYLAFGKALDLRNIPMEGIEKISLSDIKYANMMEYEIKLIAIAHDTPNGLYAEVAPFLISTSHIFSLVKDNFNAISIKYDAADEITFIGKGAGKLPTASAVFSNIIHIMEHKNLTQYKTIEKYYVPNYEYDYKYYIRFQLKTNLINSIDNITSNPLIHKHSYDNKNLIILTNTCSKKALNNFVNGLSLHIEEDCTSIFRILEN